MMVSCLHVVGVREVEEAKEDRIEEAQRFKNDSDEEEEVDQPLCLYTQLTNPFLAISSNSTIEVLARISNR